MAYAGVGLQSGGGDNNVRSDTGGGQCVLQTGAGGGGGAEAGERARKLSLELAASAEEERRILLHSGGNTRSGGALLFHVPRDDVADVDTVLQMAALHFFELLLRALTHQLDAGEAFVVDSIELSCGSVLRFLDFAVETLNLILLALVREGGFGSGRAAAVGRSGGGANPLR